MKGILLHLRLQTVVSGLWALGFIGDIPAFCATSEFQAPVAVSWQEWEPVSQPLTAVAGPSTRVPLSRQEGEEHSEYINANFTRVRLATSILPFLAAPDSQRLWFPQGRSRG